MDANDRSLGPPPESVNANAGEGTGAAPEGLAAVTLEILEALTRPEPARATAERVTRAAVETGGAARAILLAREPDRDELRVLGAAGLEDPADRAELLHFARRLGRWLERTLTPLTVLEPAADPRFPAAPGAEGPVHGLPLLVSGRVLGAMVVFEPAGAGTVERIAGFASLASVFALALSRERARRRIEALDRDLEESERRRLQAERLAAVGTLAADMGREVQAPLASVGGLAARLAEELPEDHPHRALLEVMTVEIARVERLLGDQVELARAREGGFRPDDLNRILAECLMLLERETRARKVRVTRRLAMSLPTLLLNAGLLRRILLNLLRGALEGTEEGGRIKVETKRRGESVEILVAAESRREPGSSLDAMWKPFSAEAGETAGTSASAVQQMLREHGATLRVAATRDWPIIYSLTLPIPGNQDRRRMRRDRRSGADRRRA
jgi:signal transduction histidine kinase